jgi:hypothetical protein
MRKIIVKNGIRLKGFPCKQLNNILSPSLDDNDLYIIHYKGSWRNILTEGNWKNSLRPDTKNDLALYNLWKTTLDRFKDS